MSIIYCIHMNTCSTTVFKSGPVKKMSNISFNSNHEDCNSVFRSSNGINQIFDAGLTLFVIFLALFNSLHISVHVVHNHVYENYFWNLT